MSGPNPRFIPRNRIAIFVCVIVMALLFQVPDAKAQTPGVLVVTRNSSLSVYDTSLNSLGSAMPGGYITWSVAVDPMNPRLAYVSAATYVSVFDLTIGREVNRMYGTAGYGSMAFTSNGKYLLLADVGGYLDIFDVARQALVRKVSLARAMGSEATNGFLGTLVVVGSKAYVTTESTDMNRPVIAVVDLNTYKVTSIPLPAAGLFDGQFGSPNAALTPDQKYVMIGQTNNSDNSKHLFFISTTTNRVVLDVGNNSFAQSNDILGLLASPVNNPGNNYGYLFGQNQAIVIDLNNINSPSYGQQLASATTPLDFSPFFGAPSAAAIEPTSSRIVLGGLKPWLNSPNPNVIEIDTAKMISNPGAAIIANATAYNGNQPFGIAFGSIVTTPPQTAPTVASVTGPITNNTANMVTVTGTNFQVGATTVRIGTMSPLPATVNSPGNLTVTVPVNAPAQANLDVVVTNPGTGGARNQQYQSGLKPGALTIQPNSAFQPLNQFASYRLGAHAVSVFEPGSGTMIDNPSAPQPLGINFNADGSKIYGSNYGPQGSVSQPQLGAWDSVTDAYTMLTSLKIGNQTFLNSNLGTYALAPSVNPGSGTAVVFVPVGTKVSGLFDLKLEMVDTDPSSGSYGTVLTTISAGLNSGQRVQPLGCAATPDGRFVYVAYAVNFSQYHFAVFDVAHSVANPNLSLTSIGVSSLPSNMVVTADGQSLLIDGVGPNNSVPIAVLDISQQPTNPVLVATISGTPPARPGGAGLFSFFNFQVVGKRLFAVGNGQQVVAFNFDRSNSNYSQLATYEVPSGAGRLAVSPDGALIYVGNLDYDLVTVLDANKLVSGQNPLITNIGAFPGALYPVVSPAAITASPLAVSTTSLPNGTQGIGYSAILAATGGTPPYTWTVTGGSLPMGLTLSPYGAITGFPSGAVTTAQLTFTVTDSKGKTASNASPIGLSILTGAALQITTSSLPSGPVNQPYFALLAAGGGIPPYMWTISGGSLPNPLTLSTAGVITGTPTTSGPSNFTVKVTDSATPVPNFTTRPLSILINGNGNAALLSGHYAIQLNGFSTGNAWTAIFAVVADGNGNITSGEFDFNQINQTPANGAVTGTYFVDSTGIGQMTLTTSLGPSITFSFALSSDGNGRIIEYDDTTGNGSRASGVIRVQNSSAFNLASISGTYAFGVGGFDSGGNTFSEAGEFAVDGAGHLTNGVVDVNDNGVLGSGSFTGTLQNLDGFGRSKLNVSGTFGSATEAVYVVSATEVLFVGIDSVPVTQTPLGNGTALLQTGSGSFNNASLNGTCVVVEAGASNGQAEVGAGLVTLDGAGHFAFQGDHARGGSFGTDSASGTYSVASNGRVTLSGQGPIFYLVSANTAFLVDSGGSSQLGTLEPQASGPFSNASIAGSYAGGSLPPGDPSINNTVGTVSGDGNGNLVYSQDTSGSSGLGQGLGHTDTVNIAPNGRGTNPKGSVLYLVSPNKAVFLGASGKAEIYQH